MKLLAVVPLVSLLVASPASAATVSQVSGPYSNPSAGGDGGCARYSQCGTRRTLTSRAP